MGRSSKETFRALLEVAMQQQGLFTAKQAEAVGYSYAAQYYQVNAGNWTRKGRGLYQLVNYPAADRPDLVRWSLWSRGADDVPQGVFSRQTALSIHGLTDLQPAKLHLTVPTVFRRRSEVPRVLILHFQDLLPTDVVEADGYRVTRALRAFIDLLRSGEEHQELLSQALQQGLGRGSITISEAKAAREAGLLAGLEVAA